MAKKSKKKKEMMMTNGSAVDAVDPALFRYIFGLFQSGTALKVPCLFPEEVLAQWSSFNTSYANKCFNIGLFVAQIELQELKVANPMPIVLRLANIGSVLSAKKKLSEFIEIKGDSSDIDRFSSVLVSALAVSKLSINGDSAGYDIDDFVRVLKRLSSFNDATSKIV